ncbi:MAG: hypothetical protein Q7R67_01395 [bacterium]|nr:hypothetical protein [bacterium]
MLKNLAIFGSSLFVIFVISLIVSLTRTPRHRTRREVRRQSGTRPTFDFNKAAVIDRHTIIQR